jgi:hypothetical protein
METKNKAGQSTEFATLTVARPLKNEPLCDARADETNI